LRLWQWYRACYYQQVVFCSFEHNVKASSLERRGFFFYCCYNDCMTKTGFEYKKKKDETPFETFLRYTDEKEKSAQKLAAILEAKLTDGASILDIGTGNGEYLELALSAAALPDDISLTLVEPSEDLVESLKGRFKKSIPASNLRIAVTDLQNFDSEQTYDVILMSHLFYHIPRATWTKELRKALSLLKPEGILIVVMREKDDAYDFKMAFKPQLFDASFKALTIDDVLEALPKDIALHIAKVSAASELRIPIDDDLEDAVSIMEFYLNKEWDEIPEQIQQAAIEFIKAKNGTFKQLDGIAVVQQG
jgi:cyclopropane fatty-acyl-phospholipid synthase-like methyltransferase